MSSKKSTKPQLNAKTIDEKHTDMLNQFHEIETATIPRLKEEYKKWKHKFASLPESKIDGKVARHLDRDDMVVNTLQTFNSLTVQCAQCHNH